MLRKNKKMLIKTIHYIGIILALVCTAEARNGFIPQYVGLEGLVSGAGTALPLDATGVISNPAVLSRLPSHIIAMGGLLRQDIWSDTSAAAIGNPAAGKQHNRFKNTKVMTLGANYRYNEQFAVGIGISGGGGFVKYRASFINPALLNPANGGFNTQAVNAVTLFAPTVSYRPTPGQSYGISLLVGHSSFKTNLAIASKGFTQTMGGLKKDQRVGFGTRIGGLWDVSELLSIGASVATPVYFQKHKKYRDIFVDNMEIPATFRIGTAWHLSKKTDFVIDYKGLLYGESKWLSKDLGWKNQYIILTGIQHQFTDEIIAGIGYNYAKPPIRKKSVFVNALSSPIEKHHFQTGIRYKFMPQLELIATAWISPMNKMVDNGKVLPPGAGAILKDKAWGWELGIKYDF